MRKSVEERFWSKVSPEPMSGCLLWTSDTSPDGYGNFSLKNKRERAHRLAWRFAYGDIPPGQQINHKCDVRSCVNAKHLFLGTQLENIADMHSKGRHRAIRGESCHASMLTEASVMEMRASRAAGATLVSLGLKYGISHNSVRKAVIGKTWKHVPFHSEKR